MRKLNPFVSILILTLILSVSMSSPAFAYIDPGTGSYLFQMLMAGLLSSMFAVKMFWRSIRGYFSRFFSQDNSQDHEND